MSTNRIALLAVLSAAAVAACSSEPTCDYSKAPYNSAATVASLRAPAGLTAPDRSAALIVPPAPTDAKPVTAGKGKCLDRPPSYFATAPRTEAPEKKSTEK